jgi:transcriptional regulator with XRE-family HTH domain
VNTPPVITDIPTLLKWADTKRHHDGITYAELAVKLEVSKATVGHWFSGRSKIPTDKLLALIAILDSALILVRKTEPTSTGRPL